MACATFLRERSPLPRGFIRRFSLQDDMADLVLETLIAVGNIRHP